MLARILKALRETWYLWLFFLCWGFVSGRALEATQISPRAELAAACAFCSLLAFWVVSDARRRERRIGYGFPGLVFFLWPIFAPVYLFQTRHMRALLTILWFAIMSFLSAAIGTYLGATVSDS